MLIYIYIQRCYDSNSKYKKSPQQPIIMKTRNCTQLQQSQYNSYAKYCQFKQNLLQKMCQQDPLQILQSQIFEQYEQQAFPQIFHKNNTNIRAMSSKIVSYDIDGVRVKIVQRRSHSQQKINMNNSNNRKGNFCSNCKKYQDKIRRMEQQANVDLMVWSNIMHNHFSISQEKMSNLETNKQNIMGNTNMKQSVNISKLIKQSQENTQQYNFLNNSSILQQSQPIICSIVTKILKNPTAKSITLILKQLFTQIEQQQQKTIKQLNRLQKQSSKLLKITQQNSTNQLQYIVKIKHLEKIIEEKDREIKEIQEKYRICEQNWKDRENQLRKIIRGKYREIQNMQLTQQQQQQNIKTGIQGLKQRLAIDSLRRTTLCSLNRQIFEFQLKMDDLGIQIDNNSRRTHHNGQSQEQQSTQQTRCDQ